MNKKSHYYIPPVLTSKYGCTDQPTNGTDPANVASLHPARPEQNKNKSMTRPDQYKTVVQQDWSRTERSY